VIRIGAEPKILAAAVLFTGWYGEWNEGLASSR
jgi:hypothetical protein